MFPKEDTLLQIARIVKSYGTEGDVMVAFLDGMSEILKKEEPVFLFYDSLPVPFFIRSIQYKGPRKAILRLEDIDSYEDAEEAAGKDIYIDPERYPGLHDVPEEYMLTRFTVIDQHGRTIGEISDILDFSGNICLEMKDTSALIPFHEDLLIGIDTDTRTVTLHIDEGLLNG